MSSDSKMASSNVLFCLKPKAVQFSVTEEQRNQNISAFKKLESGNFDFCFLKNPTDYSAIEIVDK